MDCSMMSLGVGYLGIEVYICFRLANQTDYKSDCRYQEISVISNVSSANKKWYYDVCK